MDNYYCNGLWFDTYQVAKTYAEDLLAERGKYCVVYTRAEIDSKINHEQECGK
jgi:hypothetical protein